MMVKVLASGLVLAAVFSNSILAMGSSPPKPSYKLEVLKMEVVPATGQSAVIKIISKRYEFVPKSIEVKQGVPVKLILTSTDVTHGFSLPAFKIDKMIEPGKETIIEFTPDKAGTFDFHCSVFCGLGHGGMRGKLIVKP